VKVAVVGGGFTGCMAALHCARQGHEVSLWEAGARLGGVLLDAEAGGDLYFNGCQYLRQGVVDRLGWTDAFQAFPHEYGGVTALDDSGARILDDCAQPALGGPAQLASAPPIHQTARQRLEAYGPHAPDLLAWAQRFGDLERLDWRCLIPMQLSRLHFPDDARVPALKAESQRADALLAVPRRMRGAVAERAWLPKDGYSHLFMRMDRALREQGVSVHLNAPVTPAAEPGRATFRCRTQAISADATVWTANPLPLFRRLYGIRLDTPAVAMQLLVGDLDPKSRLQVPLPYYWQVFDRDSSVVRLYVYKLGGVLRYSAETVDTGDEISAWRDLERVLQQTGLGRPHRRAGLVKQRRHVHFSPQEFRVLEDLTPDLLQRGVVPGAWQHYGREEKVDTILPLIDQCLTRRNELCHA
jgi:glycine/D-amino acid oxidase-like deaminating enzyme